jgi:hypothetical protein
METPRPSPRFFAALLLLAGALGCGAAEADPPRRAALSLLAVGDTGKPVAALRALDPGHAVADAMAGEDARDPVDAIVLLGDNFYPDGLEENELKDRLRENLVALLPLRGSPCCGAGSLHDACPGRGQPPSAALRDAGQPDYGEARAKLQRRRAGTSRAAHAPGTSSSGAGRRAEPRAGRLEPVAAARGDRTWCAPCASRGPGPRSRPHPMPTWAGLPPR